MNGNESQVLKALGAQHEYSLTSNSDYRRVSGPIDSMYKYELKT